MLDYPAPPDAHAHAHDTHAQAQAHDTHAQAQLDVLKTGFDSPPLLPVTVLVILSATSTIVLAIDADVCSSVVAILSATSTMFTGFSL